MNRREMYLMLGAAMLCSGTTAWALKRDRGVYLQMGTSITAGLTPDAGNTPRMVGKRIGMDGVNVAVGGAFAGRWRDGLPHRSLCALVDAILSKDWTAQKAETNPIYRDHIARLAATDLSRVDILGLEYGTNDYAYGVPIGDRAESGDKTLCGALNYSVSKLAAAFPGLRLFLIVPSWRLNPRGLDSDGNPNGIGLYLKDYVDAMTAVAERHHIPCLDMWRTLGIGIDNYRAFSIDGTHPNDAGEERRADVIAAFIRADLGVA